MTAESPGTMQRRAQPSLLARCLRLAAGALALLVASEIIWLWQTWPVRQLLQPPPVATAPASSR